MEVTLIGVDCATQAKNIGLARGVYTNSKARLEEVIIGSNNISILIPFWSGFSNIKMF